MRVLVTGAAGFIGMHVAQRLLENGNEVAGIDNLNDYYDVRLKRERLRQLTDKSGFVFAEGDIADADFLASVFSEYSPERVVNLAAQPGVRYSLENPAAYIHSNLTGFGNILEACRRGKVNHLVYASSSSVYGNNRKTPFSEQDNVDYPVSLYAATKKSNELMAHTYSHLFRLPTTGLRFFTVYGPWGRPDMSPWLFTQAILEGKPIKVFNHGKMKRDFTYIDDIVEGTVRVLDKAPVARAPDTSLSTVDSGAPYRIFNIGNNKPVALLDYIRILESALGREAKMDFLPMQPGDVVETFADISALQSLVGFQPETSLSDGIGRWVEWFKAYNGY